MGSRVRFGAFVFDAERRELTRSGVPVHLSPKAFDLLAILIEQRPRAVRSQEIYERLWPETFVEPANVNNLISEIRMGLDDRERVLVVTKRRFGFAFTAETVNERPASAVHPDLLYRIVCGAKEIDLPPGRNLIGRDRDCAVVIDSPAVSRQHASIETRSSGATLEDLGSRNGTFLRGRRITSPVLLQDGDEIEVGRTLLRVRIFDRRATTISDVT
ncbi:MAG TPA: FHA domain-containing protein [Thermoanaerobaculia bacterium]